jgi:hypothetical protein
MLSGQFLATPGINDQYTAGYAFRHWAAVQWHADGGVPLWNPTLFGGLPFVAAMHGDIFYPTAWLRLFLPTDVAMNLGFFVHYILAGVFAYWFLRTHKVSWAGAVGGGLAYQLSGVIASYANPGHDGKLFVTALLPLALVVLTYAIRRDRLEGFALFALLVGMALLSPQAQATQYLLVACGIYTLYLVVEERRDASLPKRLAAVGLALAGVALGLGIAMVQYLPFLQYIPFSPRGERALSGFDWSVSFAVPWLHVPEFFFSNFAGSVQTYWGSNPLKYHSEYLGLSVIGLATLGVLDRSRRRLIYWLAGIGVLFLHISLGGETPFYRVWWTVVPFVKQTRAPGMAFYVVSLVVAAFAAFGIERVERGAGVKHAKVWLAVGAAVALVAVAGGFGALAESLARGVQTSTGVQRVPAALAGQGAIRLGAFVAGIALLAVGGSVWAYAKRKIELPVLAMLLVAIVGADLWLNARGFWHFSRPREELYARDEIIDRLTAEAKPFRVFDQVYGGAALMAHGVSQLGGYHGNQLHAFDRLLPHLRPPCSSGPTFPRTPVWFRRRPRSRTNRPSPPSSTPAFRSTASCCSIRRLTSSPRHSTACPIRWWSRRSSTNGGLVGCESRCPLPPPRTPTSWWRRTITKIGGPWWTENPRPSSEGMRR